MEQAVNWLQLFSLVDRHVLGELLAASIAAKLTSFFMAEVSDGAALGVGVFFRRQATEYAELEDTLVRKVWRVHADDRPVGEEAVFTDRLISCLHIGPSAHEAAEADQKVILLILVLAKCRPVFQDGGDVKFGLVEHAFDVLERIVETVLTPTFYNIVTGGGVLGPIEHRVDFVADLIV